MTIYQIRIYLYRIKYIKRPFNADIALLTFFNAVFVSMLLFALLPKLKNS